MKCPKQKFDPKCMVTGVFLLCCAALGLAKADDKKAIEYQKVQRFRLCSRLSQADRTLQAGGSVVHMGANVVRLAEGEVKWIAQDVNGFVIDVEVSKIDLDFLVPQPKEPAKVIQTKPFAARITMAKHEQVPLSITITEARIDDKPLELTEQYKIVYLILDLMCATALNKEFVVSEKGWGASLKLQYPEKVNLEDYGERPVIVLKSSSSPTEFTVFPEISKTRVETTQAFSFTHGSLTIDFFSRLLDNRTGFAVHAVNLEATAKKEVKKKNYTEMIRVLNAPHEFESYHLHELRITDAK